ncbi:MAG TPA: collagen-like protein [Thermoleophilaceae bacterium]|nr:collagen-like protein [Thermoleophilaceae bacterium]
MSDRAHQPETGRRRLRTLISAVAGACLAFFVAADGSALAARGLMKTRHIAMGAVTSAKIRDGSVMTKDMDASTLKRLLGAKGKRGSDGAPGSPGADGANGARGTDGRSGANGVNGTSGTNGVAGANGANGANGPNGANGDDGVNGVDGDDGTNGTNGTNGTFAPLSATGGSTPLLTATPPTVVVSRASVPAGKYVVLAKSQLTHTGAGDAITCELKTGATVIDTVAMKTLPALAAIPMSMQAVTTTASSSTFSVECDVQVAGGTAADSSLILIPTA